MEIEQQGTHCRVECSGAVGMVAYLSKPRKSSYQPSISSDIVHCAGSIAAQAALRLIIMIDLTRILSQGPKYSVLSTSLPLPVHAMQQILHDTATTLEYPARPQEYIMKNMKTLALARATELDAQGSMTILHVHATMCCSRCMICLHNSTRAC